MNVCSVDGDPGLCGSQDIAPSTTSVDVLDALESSFPRNRTSELANIMSVLLTRSRSLGSI